MYIKNSGALITLLIIIIIISVFLYSYIFLFFLVLRAGTVCLHYSGTQVPSCFYSSSGDCVIIWLPADAAQFLQPNLWCSSSFVRLKDEKRGVAGHPSQALPKKATVFV